MTQGAGVFAGGETVAAQRVGSKQIGAGGQVRGAVDAYEAVAGDLGGEGAGAEGVPGTVPVGVLEPTDAGRQVELVAAAEGGRSERMELVGIESSVVGKAVARTGERLQQPGEVIAGVREAGLARDRAEVGLAARELYRHEAAAGLGIALPGGDRGLDVVFDLIRAQAVGEYRMPLDEGHSEVAVDRVQAPGGVDQPAQGLWRCAEAPIAQGAEEADAAVEAFAAERAAELEQVGDGLRLGEQPGGCGLERDEAFVQDAVEVVAVGVGEECEQRSRRGVALGGDAAALP